MLERENRRSASDWRVAMAAPIDRASALRNPFGSCDVLVVEDDPLTRRAIVELLQGTGHRVVAARDGADALRVLDHTVPALILLDLALPVMGGAEFAREVRRRGIGAKIVLMSAAWDARPG